VSDSIPECTQVPLGDLGHGVSAELRYVGGVLDGVAYWHPCKGVTNRPDYVSVKPAWSDGWDVVSVEPLTLVQSLLCRICGHHGHLREGRWIPA